MDKLHWRVNFEIFVKICLPDPPWLATSFTPYQAESDASLLVCRLMKILGGRTRALAGHGHQLQKNIYQYIALISRWWVLYCTQDGGGIYTSLSRTMLQHT